MKLTEEDKKRISFLSKRIEDGRSDESEYLEYEKLLLEAGVPLSEFREKLYEAGLNSWGEYASERRTVRERERKSYLNIDVLAFILAIGFAVTAGIFAVKRMRVE